MNALILAAGYATRLYPLTLNQPKPLLPVAGKPMLQWVVEQLHGIPDLSAVFIVTNGKFAGHFAKWADGYAPQAHDLSFVVVDDGSTSDADKLGAIGDIGFTLDRHPELTREGLLIVAGDNLFSQSLRGFAEFARSRPATLGVYDVKDLALARKYNRLATNPAGVITEFEEKPENPTSTWCGIALYHYSPETLALLQTYLAEGNNPDQPGRFIAWLYPRVDVSTYPVAGLWYDVGSHESLAEANRIFGEKPA